MWLTNTTSLLLESVLEPRNVQYAILSHTWEQDEVSLQYFGNLDFAGEKPGPQIPVYFGFISDLSSVLGGGLMLDWLAGGGYRWFS
ncbi:het domain protein [Fusarium subglutinans]|uniref:Het domain protein n=1 Tax=Gibberella subglutinans TaxID=42677 RepID=A0A8H5L659_GIBSU|nr:het domain protein [Fusarium subglutinans]KAF5585613.1 het domain protein [Fusarium subglutinans]